MEGYFPIHQYCRITGISKDTAHHRAIRGTVEAFKNKEDRWFLYFCDESDPIPEGFIHYTEYAKSIGIRPETVWNVARKYKLFPEDDYIVARYMTPQGAHRITLYIRKGIEYPNSKDNVNKREAFKLMNSLRPKGYLTVKEFCEREHCSKYYVYNRLTHKKIQGINVSGHWFIDEKVMLNKRSY